MEKREDKDRGGKKEREKIIAFCVTHLLEEQERQ